MLCCICEEAGPPEVRVCSISATPVGLPGWLSGLEEFGLPLVQTDSSPCLPFTDTAVGCSAADGAALLESQSCSITVSTPVQHQVLIRCQCSTVDAIRRITLRPLALTPHWTDYSRLLALAYSVSVTPRLQGPWVLLRLRATSQSTLRGVSHRTRVA